jgi:hypothetical protein
MNSPDSVEPGQQPRRADNLFDAPRRTKKQALAVARRRDADMVAAEKGTSAMYSVEKPETTWAAEFRAAQAILETGKFRWGGDSKRCNLDSIERGGIVDDGSENFEVPPTPQAGAHMQAYDGWAYARRRSLHFSMWLRADTSPKISGGCA